MIQYDDGAFGSITPIDTLLQQLAERGTEGVRTVHFGTLDELERVKKGEPEPAAASAAIEEKLSGLEEQMRELQARMNEATAEQHTHGVRVYPATALAHLR